MIVVFALIAGQVAVPVTERELLRSIVEVESVETYTDVVLNPHGDTQTIIGQFNLGLEPGFSTDEAVLAVRRFVEERKEWFGPHRNTAFSTWRVKQDESDVDGLRVITLTQWSNGVRWLDSEVVVAIGEDDGMLRSISGEFRDHVDVPDMPGEVGIEPSSRRLVREVARGDVVRRVGVDDGIVHREYDLYDDAVTKNCAVTRRNWSTSPSGLIGSVMSLSGSDIRLTRCEGDEIWFTSNCTFKLRAASAGQGLHQLVDGSDDGVGQNYEVVVPCSTTSPPFTTTNTNYAEQRNVFAWLSQAANVAQAYMFAPVTPSQTGKVRPHVDYDILSNGKARYNDATHEIFFHSSGDYSTPWTAWHEYGHHVANMYGNFSNACDAYVDEGDALDEAVGAMVAMVTMMNLNINDPDVAFSYGAARGMGLASGSVMAPHSVDFGERTYSSLLCEDSKYTAAIPFAQAFWEALSNRNCQNTTCERDTYAFRSGTAALTNHSEVVHVAGMAKSLAHALKMTPANTTFQSILLFMMSSWNSSFGSYQTTNNIRAVFTHHGY